MKEISEDMISELVYELMANGRRNGTGGLARKTVTDVLIVLKSILNYGEATYGVRNPIKDSTLVTVVKKENFTDYLGTKEIEPLSVTECRKLTEFLLINNSMENVGILCGLYTGLRLGELCALRWRDVDTLNGVIHVRMSLARIRVFDDSLEKTKVIMSAPKTKNSIRDIPIPEFLLPIIRKNQKSPECFFLTGTERNMNMRTHQKHFKRILKLAGIRSVGYHCLRHTFATNCVALDFDVKTLSELLGHSDITITMNRYVHCSLHRKQVQMKKLTSLVEGICENYSF